MFVTAEVRWFRRGSLPAEVRASFEARGSSMAYQAPRRDLYLGLPLDSLSVKLREGRVEIKQRRQPGQVLRLQPQVAGVMERWQKWSLILADPAIVQSREMGSDPSWLAVDKHRGVARYRLTGEGHPEPVAPDVYPAQGCDVEMAELYAFGQAWWSLCFEAFGQGPELPQLLQATARHFLESIEPPHLAATDSYGYPRWLANVAGLE